MTRSELIEKLIDNNLDVDAKNVEQSVKAIIAQMAEALVNGDRIEIRGFGSFSLHFRQPRIGRNPKTGEQVKLGAKYVPHFKAGKELRERVDSH